MVGVIAGKEKGRTRPPFSSRQAGQPQLRTAIPAIRCQTVYGTRILLLSMVTASRAKALPDRLAAVFSVTLA